LCNFFRVMRRRRRASDRDLGPIAGILARTGPGSAAALSGFAEARRRRRAVRRGGRPRGRAL
jgi:hypothetical protein